MTVHEMTEQAYKNGYAKGFADGQKAAEPKFGRWIVHSSGRGLQIRNWAECSECHVSGSPEWKRCPVCEAKMHLEV